MPAVRPAVEKVAIPPESVTVPSIVLPSANVTDPAAEFGVTDAVKITFCPKLEGFSDDASLAAGVGAGLDLRLFGANELVPVSLDHG